MWTGYQFYALITVILVLKMFTLSFIQGRARLGSNTFAIPEDARYFAHREPASEELPIVRRAAMAWRNDLENIPIFLFLAMIYVTLGCWPQGVFVYFTIFTIARIGHTATYLNAIQPWRTITFAVGMVIQFLLCIHILIAVL